ncbi:MAG: pilus assembly FimT family protein [Planctomycetota bacterium]|jgi:prepilin-type N-terminal cleavage/methylation domain-containing protein
MKRPGPQAGFTLIEITAVVILVALIASSALVRLDGVLPSTRVESAGREVLATLDMARIQAIAKSQPYEVLFDFEEQRYGIRMPFDEDGVLIPNLEDRPILSWNQFREGAQLQGVMDSRGEIIEEGRYPVIFDPLGAAREVHIYLGSSEIDDFELTIRILALTGIASVFQGHIEPQLLIENDF